MTPWERLGIAPGADPAEIRRAYARALKAIDPDSDPEGFIALRDARDRALAYAAGHGEASEAALPPPRPDPVEQAPELPPFDTATAERLHALLFAAEPPDPAELAALARALLDDPALEAIDAARWVEAFLAETIVQATPRSDPLIEPAIAHFRWDTHAPELGRPPILDWILARREGIAFEADLAASAPAKARLLATLRAPPAPLGGLRAWWLGPEVEFLLVYLQQLHPTAFAGLDRDTLAWWQARFEAQRRGPFAWLRRLRYRRAHAAGLYAKHDVGLGEAVLIFLFPYLFALLLLDPGYSRRARIAGFGWLAFCTLCFVVSASRGPPAEPAAVPPAPRAAYSDPATDLDADLVATGTPRLTLAAVERANPPLHLRLVERWRSAAASGEEMAAFDSAIGDMLGEAVHDALRAGTPALRARYWGIEAEKLRWLEARDPMACAEYLRGEPRLPFPPELAERERPLITEAVLASADPPPRAPWAPPPPLLELAAQARSGLEPDRFRAGLTGGASAAERCAARRALVEAALAAPRPLADDYLKALSADR
jgi:hypothetical protein